MAGGRPIEYNKDIVKKAQEYLESCVDEEVERIKTEGDKSTTYELGVKVSLPSVEGLSLYLGVHRSTIYDWKEKYQEFSDILGIILQEQAKRLLENGLSGRYNSTIAKLILTKHGYVERQEISGKDGKDLIPEKKDKSTAMGAIKDFLNK